MSGKHLTYREAGVDIEAGEALVERIKPMAARTMRPEVLGGIGGFGALFEVSRKYKQPVMVSGTDGVGTKLKLAFRMKKHDTRKKGMLDKVQLEKFLQELMKSSG